MFGSIGGFEMLVLMAIGLLVFGPRKLPEIGRTLGRAMVEFRRAAMDLRTSIEREINLEELRDTTRSVRQDLDEGIRGAADAAKQAIPQEVRDLGQIQDIRPDSQPRPSVGLPPSTDQPEPRSDDVARKD